MSDYYNKYSNSLKYYEKPRQAEIKRTSSVNYFTDDDRHKSKFKPLIQEDEDRTYPSGMNELKYYNPHEHPSYAKPAYKMPTYQAAPSSGYYQYPVPIPQPIPQPVYYEHPAYAVPKYEPVYEAPPQLQFIAPSYKAVGTNSHTKLREAQNDYYAKKRAALHGSAFSDRSLAEKSENLNSRQKQRKGRFEDFMKYTAPRLQYKKIILIQALFKGAYVRKRIYPQIKQFHVASVRVVDSMIDHYIEDVYIPDLLLELLSKNRVYENFDLYSDENKILYEIRASILDKVIRDMVKDIVKDNTERIVNRYLNKRFRDKDADERDPLCMVSKGIMDGVMKTQAKDIVKE